MNISIPESAVGSIGIALRSPPIRKEKKDMLRQISIADRVVLAIVGLIGSTAGAETITVCSNGCDHSSVNAAIAASSDGDVIQLSAETYAEGVVIDTNGKAITLRGVTGKGGVALSVLDGGESHRVLQCINGETGTTTFENLVIQKGQDFEGGGMFNLGSSPTLNNCEFAGNRGVYDGGGMFNQQSSSPAAPL